MPQSSSVSLPSHTPTATVSEVVHMRQEAAVSSRRAAQSDRLLKEAVSELAAWRRDRSSLIDARDAALARVAEVEEALAATRAQLRGAWDRPSKDAAALGAQKRENKRLIAALDMAQDRLKALLEEAKETRNLTSLLRAQLEAADAATAAAQQDAREAKAKVKKLKSALKQAQGKAKQAAAAAAAAAEEQAQVLAAERQRCDVLATQGAHRAPEVEALMARVAALEASSAAPPAPASQASPWGVALATAKWRAAAAHSASASPPTQGQPVDLDAFFHP